MKGTVLDVFTIGNHFGDISKTDPKLKKNIQPKPTANSFFASTAWDLIHFSYINGHFITNETNIKSHKIKTPITCGTAFEVSRAKVRSKNVNSGPKEDLIMIMSGNKSDVFYLLYPCIVKKIALKVTYTRLLKF